MGRVCLIELSLLGMFSCWGEALDNQPSPKSPLESLGCIRVPPGFRVEIVATEPLIESPVAFDWGADGKLWVVEMRDYPGGSRARPSFAPPGEQRGGYIAFTRHRRSCVPFRAWTKCALESLWRRWIHRMGGNATRCNDCWSRPGTRRPLHPWKSWFERVTGQKRDFRPYARWMG